MQKSMTIVAVFAAALVVGGCQKADSTTGRMQYRGMGQLAKAQSGSLPEADVPTILPQTHFAAGMLFEEQGNIGKAITQYRKAVALNHYYVAAYHRLGRMYSLAGKHDAAIQAVARACEIKPDNAILHNDLSFEYMFVGRWGDAERSLRRAIELRPTMARAHINLALVQSKQGRFDDALLTFRQVLPEADSYYNLGLLFRGHREYAKAADAFRRVLAINENFTVAQAQLDEVVADLRTNKPEKVDMVGPAFAEASDIPSPRAATPGERSFEQGNRRVEARTPTPTPTVTPNGVTAAAPDVTRKFELRDDGPGFLAEAVRSILFQSADAVGQEKRSTRGVEFERSFSLAAAELDRQDKRDRERLVQEINVAIDARHGETLVEAINAALTTRFASSRRSVSTAVASVVTPSGEVECDELEETALMIAGRSLLFDELERLSYNTDEEFVEIEQDSVPPVVVARADTYRDFYTEEEFIEPNVTTPPTLPDFTKLMTPSMKLTRREMFTPELRYEDFLTDEEFVENGAQPSQAARNVATGEMSAARVEWNQELVTLDELIDIMDNERRCFVETDFATVASEWPIADALAYSPVEFDAPRPALTTDPWADFVRVQSELDARALQVTVMVDSMRSRHTETKLVALEERVAAMGKQVDQRSATARRNTEARRLREARLAEVARADMVQRRRDRLALGQSLQKSEASRRARSNPTENPRERRDRVIAPMVLAGPHGPPASAMADGPSVMAEGRDRSARRTKRATRTAPARGTTVVHRGVERNWRDGFLSIDAMAAIVSNDLVCLNDETMSGRDAVALFMDGREGAVSMPRSRANASGVLGAWRSQSKSTQRR